MEGSESRAFHRSKGKIKEGTGGFKSGRVGNETRAALRLLYLRVSENKGKQRDITERFHYIWGRGEEKERTRGDKE